MEVDTSRFGRIEVPEDSIYTFPSGLLGFPAHSKYAIISENDGPLKWMQSLDAPELAFVVCDPLTFKDDYLVQVPKSELADVGIADVSKAVVLVILVIRDNVEDITANLLGPLVFNTNNQMAKQLVLNDSNLSTKYRVLEGQIASSAS